MNSAGFATFIKGVRKSGDGWVGRCPAHDDRNASLVWHDGERAILLRCLAGCTKRAILDALGLTFRDLSFMASSTKNGTETPRTCYQLHDASGQLVAVHVREDRNDGKRMWWEQPDGARTLGGIAVADLPLYGIETLDGAATVIVTEGEKAREALALRGFPVVASVTGAAATPSAASLRPLLGRCVVLWPDHDDPGRQHMRRIAEALRQLGHHDVRLLHWPGASEKGDDAADFFARGGTADECRSLIDGAQPVTATPSASLDTTLAAARPVLVNLSTVTPKRPEMIWPLRIARGKMTVLAGEQGLGKSFILYDVAARITRGAPWPDGGNAPKGNVLILSAEDGADDTIRPRCDEQGGDPARITLMSAVTEGGVSRWIDLGVDLAVLEDAIRKTDPVLVVVDPITAYLGDKNSWRDADVRGVLAPLAKLAEDHRVGVVAVMHPNKAGNVKALLRVSGSVAFTAAPRIVLGVGPHPEDESGDRRVFGGIKANICVTAPFLGYRIIRLDDARARLQWEHGVIEGVTKDAVFGDGAVNSREERESRHDAETFLRELLADGPQPAKDVQKAAREAGIADKTLERARYRLGVASKRQEGAGKASPWYWHAPAAWGAWDDPDKNVNISKVTFLSEPHGKTNVIPDTSDKNVTHTKLTPLSAGGVLVSEDPWTA